MTSDTLAAFITKGSCNELSAILAILYQSHHAAYRIALHCSCLIWYFCPIFLHRFYRHRFPRCYINAHTPSQWNRNSTHTNRKLTLEFTSMVSLQRNNVKFWKTPVSGQQKGWNSFSFAVLLARLFFNLPALHFWSMNISAQHPAPGKTYSQQACCFLFCFR